MLEKGEGQQCQRRHTFTRLARCRTSRLLRCWKLSRSCGKVEAYNGIDSHVMSCLTCRCTKRFPHCRAAFSNGNLH